MKPPRFIELDEALEIHADQIRRHGGAAGIADLGLLESALAVPRSGMAGRYFHSDLIEMAAAYLFHIVMNHPFVDGNKRVGTATALVFLELNGVRSRYDNDALAAFVLEVAAGKRSKADAIEYLRRGVAS